MNFLRNISIRDKLVSIILAVSAITIIVGFTINTVVDYVKYKNELESNALLEATLVGEYSLAPLLFDYQNEASEILIKLEALPHITNACIYDKDNNIFATYSKNPGDDFSFPSTWVNGSEYTDGYLYIFKPIIFQNEAYGTVFFRISAAAIYDKVKDNIIVLILLMIGLAYPVYWLAQRLQRIISDPILALAEVTSQVGQKRDYSVRVETDRKDVIGLLYRRFNEMIFQIEKRQLERDKAADELKQLNEELEERVKLRTEELEKVNKDLIKEIEFRKLTEKALKDSEQRLSDILDYAPILVYINDLEGRYLFVNKEFEKHTKLSRKRIINKTDKELFSGERAERNTAQNQKVIATGKSQIFENPSSSQDDTRYFVDILFPIKDSNGEVYATSGWSIDITDRIKTENILKQAKENAEAANKAKSKFLANMSHELRTPMNAILGFSQLLLRDPNLKPDHAHNLNIINRSGEHLLALINDVLEMSKIEAGRISINEKDFNLHALINDLEMMFKVRTDAKNLSLHFYNNDDLPKYIFSDEGKLRQILINLLGNAVKFTDEGGVTLKVDVKNKSNDIVNLIFNIDDTGPGIDKNDIEKIFDYFEQSSQQSKYYEGTGLGLAISRQYARLMAGDISVASQVGKGSTFSLSLNIKISKQSEIHSSENHKLVKCIKGRKDFRVLVADDRETNRELLVKMLSPIGGNVREVTNGEEAIEAFKIWNPHLILMDMVMPKIDGIEAIKQIRTLPGGKYTAIIAVTASVLDDQAELVLQYGANDFVRKPFRENELFDKIARHCKIDFEYISTTTKPDSIETEPDSGKIAEEILQLSNDIKNKIRNAAINGYNKKLLEIIETVSGTNPGLADFLRSLTQKYKYRDIINAINEKGKDG